MYHPKRLSSGFYLERYQVEGLICMLRKYYNTARFRARIDGSLKTIHSCSEEQLPRFIALFKNFSNMGHQHQNLQDARFGMKIGVKGLMSGSQQCLAGKKIKSSQ